MFLSDEGPTLQTFNFTIRIGSTPIHLYFDLYLNTTNTGNLVTQTAGVLVNVVFAQSAVYTQSSRQSADHTNRSCS